MTRFLATLCAVGMLSMAVSQADAADPFRTTSDSGVSSSSLDAMGLGGMRTMTRSESSQIRGQGAVVWGSSRAQARAYTTHSSSSNGYVANGNNSAQGFNISAAGAVANGNAGVRFGLAAAGGFSRATAN